MSDRFTQKAQNMLNAALKIAREMGHSYVGTEHLLLGMLSVKDCVGTKILTKSGVIESQVKYEVENISGIGTYGYITSKDMTPGCRKIIEIASGECRSRGHKFIGTEHVLYAILEYKSCVAIKILEILSININEIKNNLETYFSTYPEEDVKFARENEYSASDKKGMKLLSLYGKNMTKAAAQGKYDPIIGRDDESLRVIQILSRRTKNNPCLVGEAGVGKTAIVEGIAQKIVDGNVPRDLQDSVIYSLDIGSMIAGAKYRGEFEERFKGIIAEVSKNNNIILFIDEIHTIVGAGAAEGALDAANIIKPILARGELRVIGATTFSEYRKNIEKDSALERRFQPVYINEPNESQTFEIIKGILPKYEEYHSVKISDDTVRFAISMSKRYISNRFLPDKAIDLIDESASRVKIERSDRATLGNLKVNMEFLDSEKNRALLEGDFTRLGEIRNKERGLIDADDFENSLDISDQLSAKDIAKTLSLWTGIDMAHILGEEKERLASLSLNLSKRVIGQTDAIKRVSKALLRSRSGIANKSKPLASFLFAGPTGVGKTELCKALATELFGSEEDIIRFDMSEYMDKHTSSKLIGSPPGYIGYDDGGQLTERARRNPYSIVLFDEIEKGHRDIFNLLLQVLDEGCLKDSQGVSVDFKNTVIIMTSNIGNNESISLPVGFANSNSDDQEKNRTKVKEKIKEHFTAEFLNRIDDIIIFDYLDDESMRKITQKTLDESCKNIRKNGIEVEYSPEVIDFIISRNNNKKYGAREIKRLVTDLFEDSYIESYYDGKINFADKLMAKVYDGKIVFENKLKSPC